MERMFKTGSSSIVLGSFYFNKFVDTKDNKLLKITKINYNHNELKYLSYIRKIEDYDKYYVIPDEELYYIKPTHDFYEYIKKMADEESRNIFIGTINCYFINYAGDQDLYETIYWLSKNNFSVWNSYKKMYKFCHKIALGLNYLHQQKICHLDIKPENIIYNSDTQDFRIIDFGFSSIEPFDDFVINIRGTPGYMPKYFPNEKITKYLPKVEANDFLFEEEKMPILVDRKLIYKVDSFCLGRVIFCIKNFYKDLKVYNCRNNERKREKKLDMIISSLINNDIYQRKTIQECLDLYF